jgi:hypothetical protein
MIGHPKDKKIKTLARLEAAQLEMEVGDMDTYALYYGIL